MDDRKAWEAYVKYAEQMTGDDYYTNWLTEDRPAILWADARIRALEEAGRKFREAIGGDYQKDGSKVTCIVLPESLAEFDEAFRRRSGREGK